ncbi:MAG TPA: tetratricopeptide repeat protein, partial [Gemmataceae bacterium]|nr:tetratricopeptide repeat protein [Gemmataceae bacterium]
MRLAVMLLLILAAPVRAGLYYSKEVIADLPAQWRGFLPDHRTLRTLAVAGIANPLREPYAADRDRLIKLAAERPLTADEAADLGTLQIRLGNPADAVAVLRDAHARFPDHFHIAANLGTAWQLHGDLDQAALALRRAVELAPPMYRKAEELHLKLVTLRRGEPKGKQGL